MNTPTLVITCSWCKSVRLEIRVDCDTAPSAALLSGYSLDAELSKAGWAWIHNRGFYLCPECVRHPERIGMIEHRVQVLRHICSAILDITQETENKPGAAHSAALSVLADLEHELGALLDTPDVQKVKRPKK